MPRPKDWDAPTDLRSAAREAEIEPDWSDPEFQGFVEEHKWNEREYNTEWKRNNIDAERARQISGEHDSARLTRKTEEKTTDKIEREYLEEARRLERQGFVRSVTQAVERSSEKAFPIKEQAETLRKMADQIEREGRGDPVQRTQERLAERSSFRGQFFRPKPEQPTPEMRDKWLADHKARSNARENEAADTMRGDARAVDSLPPTPQPQETPSGYAYVPAPANNPPLSIKPMPQRDRTKDFDRDR